MQQGLSDESTDLLNKIDYYIGSSDVIKNMVSVPVRPPFADIVCDFLSLVSKHILSSKEAKVYPDVVTLGFWLRKASLEAMKKRFLPDGENIRMGRGVAFHIAPSNVPVNYAYSLAAGLLTGNANIVRIPSKTFPQIDIINNAIEEALSIYDDMKTYICLVRYGRDKNINDILSAMADTRIVWGGDSTIEELRKSPLGARATEITFADRYSLTVIDSDGYMKCEDKEKLAADFYNDTYLTDQNACTSPKLVIWLGGEKDEAKKFFWTKLHDIVKEKYQYQFQPVMGVNKLTSAYLMCNSCEGSRIMPQVDNLITRVQVKILENKLLDIHEATGFFVEYDCDDILELSQICNDVKVQTIGYIGEIEQIRSLVATGIRGVDRVVPVGKTMDFDLIWDGYNLVERLTREITLQY